MSRSSPAICPPAISSSCSACCTSSAVADAAIEARLGQAQAVGCHLLRPARDRELEVERPQREVGLRHVRDQGGDDPSPRFFGREILRARGLGQPPQPSPDVDFPAQVEPGLRVAKVPVDRVCRNACAGADGRDARLDDRGRGINRRELIGARHPEERAGLQHALGGDAQIEVLLERTVDQLRQRLVLEQVEPLRIRQRYIRGRCIRPPLKPAGVGTAGRV